MSCTRGLLTFFESCFILNPLGGTAINPNADREEIFCLVGHLSCCTALFQLLNKSSSVLPRANIIIARHLLNTTSFFDFLWRFSKNLSMDLNLFSFSTFVSYPEMLYLKNYLTQFMLITVKLF